MNIIKNISSRHISLFIALLIAVITAIVFWQVRGYDFVNFDDNEYVFLNPHVQKGITLENMVWAFTAFHSGNWHPLTWVSHMLDCRIFGLWAGGHHLTSLLFHVINSLLVFFVFHKMTCWPWQSGLVAALFALHPLHVESVAWISERKDVLSTFFYLLALLAYVRYVQRPGWRAWGLVLLLFIFGLMSKPMVVTLPFVLLLMDFWPLKRFSFEKPGTSGRLSIFRLLVEKTPLFAFAVISCIITINAQKQGASITDLSVIPFGLRISNALAAYTGYMAKALYPFDLAVLYPYQRIIPWWKIVSAVAILASISLAAFCHKKDHPYLIVGWLWYIGTLVPVIGLVQIGRQSMADRYTYIPLIGLFIMAAWGIPQLADHRRHINGWLAAIGILVIGVLAVLSWSQAGHWKNSESLFRHALKKTEDNYLAHHNLGLALYHQGHIDDAISNYRHALRIHPHYVEAQNNLGQALLDLGQVDEAIMHFQNALHLNPQIPAIHLNIGLALSKKGNADEAIRYFLQATSLDPTLAIAHLHAADTFYGQNKMDRAIQYYKKTLDLKLESPHVHTNLANALQGKGYTDQAIDHYLQAIKINPNLSEIYNNLGVAWVSKGEVGRAIQCFQDALRINPDYQSARNNLGRAILMKKPRH